MTARGSVRAVRVLIVEDDVRLRASLRLLLDGEASVEVVADVGSAAEAIDALESATADIALIDLGLPDRDGTSLVAELKQKHPALEIMVHTVFEDWDVVFAALRAGATSYVLKGASPRELVEALDELHRGGAPMSPSIARAVLLHLRADRGPDVLSPRERAILRAIDRGLAYKQVARELAISAHTVHSHIKNIYAALSATDRKSALAAARRRGLL